MISKILKLLNSEERVRIFILLFFMLISMLLEILSISLFIPIVSLIINPENFLNYAFVKELRTFIGNPDYKVFLSYLLLLIVFVYLLKNLFLGFVIYQKNKLTFKIRENAASKLFKNYLDQNISFFLNKNSSEIIYTITTESSYFAMNLILPVLTILAEGLIVIGVIILLLVFDPISTLIVFSIVIVTSLITIYFFKRELLKLGTKRQIHENLRLRYINETFNMIKEIFLLKKEVFFYNRYLTEENIGTSVSIKQATIKEAPRLILETVTVISFSIFIFFFLSSRTDNLIELIPSLTLFAVSAFRLMPSASRIIGSAQAIQHGVPALNKMYDLIQSNVLKGSNYNNSKFDEISRNVKLNFKNEIALKDLSFKYSNESIIFDNLNLSITPGKHIGIMGPSGSGKSTLINIILGFLKPNNGFIEIDGKKLSDENIRSWQNIIGYVPQSIYLIDDSIKKNIALGVPDNAVDHKLINQIIDQVNLREFINHLPEGLETNVGERGARISGGQLQRIGIARALYQKPKIVILDEATSALDENTEQEVLKEVFSLNNEITIIIISHKKKSLSKVNKIYYLNNNQLNQKF